MPQAAGISYDGILIRLGSYGDLYVTSSTFAETANLFPGKSFLLAGPALWLKILSPDLYRHITGLLVFEDKRNVALYKPVGKGTKAVWEKIADAQPWTKYLHGCEILINLRFESFRYAWAPFFKQVPVRVGSSPWYMKWLYTHWYGWINSEPDLHERDWLIDIVRATPRTWLPIGTVWHNLRQLAARNAAIGGSIFRTKDPLSPLRSGYNNPSAVSKILRRKQYLLVNPTSSRRGKAWPAGKFREFCARLKTRYKIVIIGAPNETDWLNEVAAKKFPVVQPRDIAAMFDVVAGAAGLITNTSSMQFAASSANTPVFTLMGWARPERWGPLGKKNAVFRGHTDYNDDIQIRDELAYKSIEVAPVVAAVQSWLAGLKR